MGKEPWRARAKAIVRDMARSRPLDARHSSPPRRTAPSAEDRPIPRPASTLPRSAALNATSPYSTIQGKIERESGGRVTGWLYSSTNDVTPILFVDGEPAELTHWTLPRRDISQALGTDVATGFRFRLPGARRGAELELFGLVGNQLESVDRLKSRSGAVRRSAVQQLVRASELARDPDCVAITCWEAGHNPIGRAKVLYDVAKLTRPAVLLAYSFEEFGTELWRPLEGTDTEVVVIPWRQREMYHALMRDLGLRFSDVWMCKPRLPTFLLTAQIAGPDARLVLDLDDNEHHFSLSKGSRRKPYGLPSLGLARSLMDEVPARTVASLPLQEDFGGQLVRHARAEASGTQPRQRQPKAHRGRRVPRVAFVGTVRPHKNLLAAARSISALKSATGREVEFHVLGDVSPPELKKELAESGAKVGGLVPLDRLPGRLAGMDCILTGFPSAEAGDEAITRYQISAKIGDALAVGKPVLVPEGPSVRDLAATPGVYLFNEDNFTERLGQALDAKEPISLPEQFSLEGAAKAFDEALREAEAAPGVPEALRSLLPPAPGARALSAMRQDTILLIWKQHDASLYGRRVDQVARSYKRANPASRVVVLELIEGSDQRQYTDRATDYTSDAAAIMSAAAAKTGAGLVDADGVVYRALRCDEQSSTSSEVEAFLVAEQMLPHNTRVVIFPIVRHYEKFAHVLAGYRKIADVVDNQFAWTSNSKTALVYARQYNILLRSAAEVVFNSAANREFFESEGILQQGDPRVRVIPNWYTLPKGMADELQSTRHSARQTVVYTGNMNDRLDWELLASLSARLPEMQLVLVGSAGRAGAAFDELLLRDNVAYLGALNERDTLKVLARSDVAVMPHVVDDVSTYMNPLKVHMYESVGLPVVACVVPGLAEEGPLLTRVEPPSFVDTVEKKLSQIKDSPPRTEAAEASAVDPPERAAEYVALLEWRS